MSHVTAIDLGSNSFRVLMYDYENHKTIKEYNEIVGTADGLVDTGLISNEAIQRVINAINKSSKELNYEPKNCVCVTTAAMRIAKNSSEAINEIYYQTGIKLEVIDGVEEARLTLLAVKYALKREKIQSSKFVLLDIGGGSTELIVSQGDDHFSKSFDFGIVTMGQKHNDMSHVLKDLQDRKKEIANYLNSLNIDLSEFEYVSTAGTPTTVASIKHGQNFLNYDKLLVNGTRVNLNDLEDCLKIFEERSVNEINALVGENRKNLIEVGILIYKTIFEVLNKKESIVLDDGLREGVAINYGIKV